MTKQKSKHKKKSPKKPSKHITVHHSEPELQSTNRGPLTNMVLWLIAISLLVGMVISFTPSLGNRNFNAAQESPALLFNGEAISEYEVSQARRNPPYNLVTEGPVGEDLNLLLLSQLMDSAAIDQASADTRVSRSEVRKAVNEFREGQNVAGSRNDSAYLNLIRNQGFTDETFRTYQKENLRRQKYLDSLTEDVEVSDKEIQDFYKANKSAYMTEPKIVARVLVVETPELADELRVRALAGEDFTELATANSIERADVGGALNADADGNPQAVGRAALPTSVARAAFGLAGQGITDVVSSNDQHYVVSVYEYIPEDYKPFAEVQDQVKEDTLQIKENAILNESIEALRDSATVETPNPDYSIDNPVVATVGDEKITKLELAEQTYLNPQVQQYLSPDTAGMVEQFFKQTSLNQLIEQKLALQGAKDLDLQLVGSEQAKTRSILNYIASDVTVEESDLEEYYDTNQANFNIPASARALQLTFETEEEARAFRERILEEGLDLPAVRNLANEEALLLTDHGKVAPGILESEIDQYLFGTDAFAAVPEAAPYEVSDVIVLERTIETPADETESTDTAASVELQTSNATESTNSTTITTNEGINISTEATATLGDENAEEGSSETTETTPEEENTNEATTETNATDEANTEANAEESTETTETVDAETTETTSDEAETTTETAEPVVKTSYNLLIALRTPERVRSFAEVRTQIEQTVLQTKRSEAQQNWLDELRAATTIDNTLAQEQSQGITIDGEIDGEVINAETFTTTPLPEEEFTTIPLPESEGSADEEGSSTPDTETSSATETISDEQIDEQAGETSNNEENADDNTTTEEVVTAEDTTTEESTAESTEDTTVEDESDSNESDSDESSSDEVAQDETSATEETTTENSVEETNTDNNSNENTEDEASPQGETTQPVSSENNIEATDSETSTDAQTSEETTTTVTSSETEDTTTEDDTNSVNSDSVTSDFTNTENTVEDETSETEATEEDNSQENTSTESSSGFRLPFVGNSTTTDEETTDNTTEDDAESSEETEGSDNN